jgi:hypothetical protein
LIIAIYDILELLFNRVCMMPTKFWYLPLFFTLLGSLCSYRGIYSNQYPPRINSRLIIPSNIHLQCICSTKNEKKTTQRWQYGIKNYFYSDSLTRPLAMWQISTLFWGTSGICVYSPRRCAPRWINHISPRCVKITYT